MLGSINAGSRAAWDFSIQDATGSEIARITKTWAGWARERFTKADNYVVQIHQPLHEPLRSLVVAAALAVDTALKMVSDEIQKLRHLIIELRPAELDEIGLEAAIQKLAARVATLGGPKVITDVELEYERGTSRSRLTSNIETTVYRIIQEALSNAVRHAGARSVHVHVTDLSGQVEARVSDDGRGFQESTKAEGFGLAGMRERAALARATLSVRTSTSGTTIEFVCPVARPRAG